MVDSNHLALALRNTKPIRAEDVSDLFGAMARDFRRMYPGHSLVVIEIRTGSLFALFKDAAEYAGSANTIIQFGKSIGQLVGILRQESSLPTPEKDEPLKTIEKLASIVANSKASVDLRYEGPDGEKLFISTDHTEAAKLGARAKKRKKAKKPIVGNEILQLSHRADLLRAIEDSGGNVTVIRAIGKILSQKGPRSLHFLEVINC